MDDQAGIQLPAALEYRKGASGANTVCTAVNVFQLIDIPCRSMHGWSGTGRHRQRIVHRQRSCDSSAQKASWVLRRKGAQSALAAVGWGQHRGSNSKGWTALHLAAADGHVACRWSCSSQGDWQGRQAPAGCCARGQPWCQEQLQEAPQHAALSPAPASEAAQLAPAMAAQPAPHAAVQLAARDAAGYRADEQAAGSGPGGSASGAQAAANAAAANTSLRLRLPGCIRWLCYSAWPRFQGARPGQASL